MAKPPRWMKTKKLETDEQGRLVLTAAVCWWHPGWIWHAWQINAAMARRFGFAWFHWKALHGFAALLVWGYRNRVQEVADESPRE